MEIDRDWSSGQRGAGDDVAESNIGTGRKGKSGLQGCV